MESAAPTLTPFERIGGEAAVRALVDRFYDEMSSDPSVRALREMHKPNLDEARDKLFWFLCGWLGGPQHFVERFGHPRLRARHLPFVIDMEARNQWMRCMERALAPIAEPDLREFLETRLGALATHMVNEPSPAG